MKNTPRAVLLLALPLAVAAPAAAQIPDGFLDPLEPRAIGPATMAGRIADFAVWEKDPAVFYVASASGGLLKTVNGGTSWENVFDDQDVVSIGDVTINPHDPNEVWVGTGEANNRQSSSWGGGVYKSTDGGRTWRHMGLEESHHVGRIVVNPVDTDIVYVAALGHLWGANPERGVFMSEDGGETWQHVLAIDDDTGVTDLAMDPANPKVIYAAAYPRRRSSWGFNGGGPQGGIYKTVDGGRSWRKLTNGLPDGPTGRIGIDIHRANPDIVYAIVQNDEGGVFRSEDKGESWERVNTLNPRPMYFSQIRVDPNDPQRVYVGGVRLHVSDDGGRTFSEESAPQVHLDHHAFWIDPNNSRHLIDGNDGGVWVSRDRSGNWEHLNNYPIGQFYNINFDMADPYHVFGGMQDNATWGGPSAVRSQQGIANEHWYQMLACDGMYVAVEPGDDDVVYTNCQNGRIVRYDRRTGERKAVQPQPGSDDEELRWNWTAPIVVSTHDPATIYTGANVVFRSRDRGHSWESVSPDLTRQIDRDTLRLLGVRGDSITQARNDGMSSFGNITSLAESTLREGLLYAGTDDGNVHVSRDGGATWTDLTERIRGVPRMLYVSRVRPSSFDEGTVYASFDGHRSDDFAPWVFVSTDYGQSWRSISEGLPAGSVYVVEEDPVNPAVLYVGTEFGLFASNDRGRAWTRWPGVPTVAVYDLKVHPRENDLVLGTHGRSILIIDDVSPLQQLDAGVMASGDHLFGVRRATQFIPNEDGWFLGGRSFRAPNPRFGAYLNYWLASDLDDSVRVAIRGPDGALVRELAGPGDAGLHRLAWDLRGEPAGPMGFGLAGAFNLSDLGPFVLPGTYTVELQAGDGWHTQTVEVRGDPEVTLTAAERRAQWDMVTSLTAMQKRLEEARERVEAMEAQVETASALVKERDDAPPAVTEAVAAAEKRLGDLRTRLLGGGGGGFGGPPTIARTVGGLKGEVTRVQSPPTAVQTERLERSVRELNEAIVEVNALIGETVPSLHRLLAEHGIYPLVGERLAPVGG